MRGFRALIIGLTLVSSGPVTAAAQTPVQVPTLPVQTPSVELPSLPVPVPTVAPAPVPVPQVALPNVTAPSLPSPTVPTTTAPSLSPSQALPGSAPSGAPGSSGRVRDTAVDSGGGTSSQATAPTSGASARGSTGTNGTGSRGTASGSHAAPSVGGRRTAERWRSARERRFRRTVRRLEPCLSTLPPLTRRILVLRAGVGKQAVLTLAQTARRVDRRQRIVRRIERRGVRLLKAAMARGECTGGSAAIAPDGEGTSGLLFGVAGGELTVAGAGGPSGGSFAETGDVGGVGSPGGDRNRTGSGDRGSVKGEHRKKQDRSLPNFPSLVSPAAKDITAPLLIVIALSGLALIAAWHRRRKRTQPLQFD